MAKIIFDKELFKKVVSENVNILSYGLNAMAEHEAVKIGKPLVSEDEVRQMAYKYFVKMLAKTLYENLKD